MRRLLFVVLVLAACKSTPDELPEGLVITNTHPEFDKFRPTAVAVLPVEAPNREVREQLREEMYRGILDKKYSGIKLQSVDAHLDSNGKFDPGDLVYDATLTVNIDTWKPRSGYAGQYVAKGVARMTHKSGELLWECSMPDRAFKVESRAGATEVSMAISEVAKFFLQRLPPAPPPPSE